MEKRYRVLRFISFVYKFLAILILIGAIIGAILAVAGPSVKLPGFSGVVPVVSTPSPGVEATEPATGASVSVPVIPATIPMIPNLTGVPMTGPAAAVTIFIGGLLWALGLYAVGDFISLLVATEQNTRAGAEYNRQAALMMREVAKRLGGGTGALR